MSKPTVRACPECDSAKLERRTPGSMSSCLAASEGCYRCPECGATCSEDEAVERESKHPVSREALSGLAQTLANTDPEEVGSGD